MSKVEVFIIFALLSGSILFLSCSNPTYDEGGDSSSSSRALRPSSSSGLSSSTALEYAFCVYPESETCYPGSYTSCPSGGVLDNNCPFDASSGSDGTSSSSEDGVSSSGEDGASSSDGDETSSNSGGGASSSSRGGASSSSVAISSSSRGTSYSYCVFETDKICLNGPASSCPPGGELSNICPYGSFTDSRNNKEYKTVIIGTQTWMAENLNYEPSSASGKLNRCYAQGGGQDDWLKPGDPKIEQNCQKYGRLYDWATAMNLSATCATTSCGSQVKEKHQGICPSGWHIPSRAEWNVLKDYVYDILWENYEDEDFGWDVGTKLKATSGWKAHSEPGNGNGVDTYGFNAIGSGYCSSCDFNKLNEAKGYYSGIGDRGNGYGETAFWWTATEYVSASIKENAYRFRVSYDTNVLVEKHESKSDLYSLRCVKD
jgi:uncharacterized protein (TIGR02145 family)